MTDEAKALVERLRQVSSVLFDDYADGTYAVEDHAICGKAADLIETQARENERLNLRLAECSAAGSTMRQTVEELHAEREKWKALAETLAGALEQFAAEWDKREFLAECHWSAYSGASQALTSYKEQRYA